MRKIFQSLPVFTFTRVIFLAVAFLLLTNGMQNLSEASDILVFIGATEILATAYVTVYTMKSVFIRLIKQ